MLTFAGNLQQMKTFFLKSRRRLLLFVLLFMTGSSLSAVVYAQISERVFKTDYRIDPEKKGELSIDVDNLSFFKDNEFSSYYIKGYSLPGLWLQTKAVYYPLDIIKVEAGVHMLRFWGANRYPNVAYQDIATWKGDQYQKGLHVLPFFRAQVALSEHVNIVLGDIYGGANHNLIEPLYFPELNLTADPEMGLQFLYNSRFFDLDTWLNWESFIFKDDTHQEAFSFGVSTRVKFNDPESRFHFYLPVQGTGQHRGGELIEIHSVATLLNGAAGIGALWNTGHPIFKNVNLEFDAAGYTQQSGSLLPFDSGYGLYARASADIYDFRIKTSYWKCHEFVSLFGFPSYGALSTKYEGFVFEDPTSFYIGLEYSREFAKGFSMGLDLDVYQQSAGTMRVIANGDTFPIKSYTDISVGIYLRINPSFLIKRF